MGQKIKKAKADYAIAALIRASYLRICVVVILVGVLPISWLVYATANEHDDKLYSAQLAQCERVLLDRRSNLVGWKATLEARRQAVTVATTPGARKLNREAVVALSALVQDLESRAHIRCKDVVSRP